MDTETTMKNGLVFDFAFELFDKRGLTYESGSFLFKDVMSIEEPFYKEKIANYWVLASKKYVKPMTVRAVRRIVNNTLRKYTALGFQIIICAYNAQFDVTHMGMTSEELTGKKFLDPDIKGIKFFDLWHGWCVGCPIEFGYSAPMTPAGNLRTTAETVFRYLTDNPNFVERHVAFFDLQIEKIILMDILKRKKKMHIVNSPKEFVSMPWKLVTQRCRKPIEFRKAKQESMAEIIEQVPDLSTKEGHLKENPTIFFPET
jgi:hypothetical protein